MKQDIVKDVAAAVAGSLQTALDAMKNDLVTSLTGVANQGAQLEGQP